jgi:hypothetical protein
MKVDLPYRFPDPADQIYDEAQRFRKLSPTDRFLAIVDMMVAADMMLKTSPHREQILEQCREHEEQWQRFHRELFAKHGF